MGRKSILMSGMVLLVAVSLPFVLSSCSDDEKYVRVPAPYTGSVSMGVAGEGTITTDKGNVLIPDESSVGHDLTDGERVFVNCSILDREDINTYRVRINKYYQLLAKDIVRASDTDDEELGDEPVQVKDAWFGGGYLNMRARTGIQSVLEYLASGERGLRRCEEYGRYHFPDPAAQRLCRYRPDKNGDRHRFLQYGRGYGGKE